MDRCKIERDLHEKGYERIACIDEVGRGCLFGPVMAAAVILPKDLVIEGVNDSKKISEKKREAFFPVIEEKALAIGYGRVEPEEIDQINIRNATKKAMAMAVENLKDPDGNKVVPDYVLVDGENIDLPYPREGIIQGDQKVQGISCASIMAKVARDREMVKLALEYPEYGLEKHKGYGTKQHRDALGKLGATPLHRKTFISRIPMAGDLTKPQGSGNEKLTGGKRGNTKPLGDLGEALAMKHFKEKGMIILNEKYRTPLGEIDLVMKDGEELAFVEVKTRRSEEYGQPIEAVTPKKAETIKKVAELYLAMEKQALKGISEIRFDVVEVYIKSRQYKIIHHRRMF